MIISGMALIILAVIFFLSSKLPRGPLITYGIAHVERAGLPNIHKFIRTILDDVAPFEVFQGWYEKNPNIIQAVIKVKSKPFQVQQEIVGFFSVFPITENARLLLNQNELLGASFTADHICKPNETPAAYYIGAMGGVGWRGREATLYQLLGYVAALLRRDGKLVYTRPMTNDGLRWARNYRFVPVKKNVDDPKNTIYVRDLSSDPSIL